MTSRSQKLLLSLRPDILQQLCSVIFHMKTERMDKRQIVSRLNQQQALRLIQTLPPFLF